MKLRGLLGEFVVSVVSACCSMGGQLESMQAVPWETMMTFFGEGAVSAELGELWAK